MYCSKCGKKIDIGVSFCPNCGNQLNTNNKDKNKINKKIIVVILLAIIIVLLLITLGLILLNNKKDDSKTIMIYMAGSNLESDSIIATSDLNSIVPGKIDLTKTNVLLYTGSTKVWHNFVSSDENAIYLLKDSGFEKLESYESKSLGDSNVFRSFLDYSYDNYKADSYNLIIWDHGLGSLGSVFDEETSDFLTLPEMSSALEKSKFNKKNKLDTVLFRTCLNATYEVASTFAPYANYMIASEEVTIGSPKSSVLNFINELTIEDNEISYGKKYINSYKNQVNDIDIFGTTDSTYSIIDLSKMDKLEDKMNDFFSDIDVSKNYNEIAKIRSNIHQYAVDSAKDENYDTVDLYELVDSLKSYSTKEADKLLKILDDMIIYNYATNSNSHGLSIYFPFNGSESYKELHLDLYNKLSLSDDYSKFIKKFNNIQEGSSSFTFNVKNNETSINNREFSLKLTDEQLENYAGSSYIIFKKEEDNYFVPIYLSKNTTLTEDGILKTNISNNILKVVDKSDNSESYINAYETKKNEYITTTMLFNITDLGDSIDYKVNSANMYVKIDNKVPVVTKTILQGGDYVGSAAIDYKDYKTVQFSYFKYNILDENGNYSEDWEGSETLELIELKTENVSFKTSTLDEDDDYYCVFKIKDVKNNYYYSNLIKIN